MVKAQSIIKTHHTHTDMHAIYLLISFDYYTFKTSFKNAVNIRKYDPN